MKTLFYCVLILHIIFFISCSGNATSQKGIDAPIKIRKDTDSLRISEFEGNWRWCGADSHTIVSMRILSHKDSTGDYLYTYYFGNRIEEGFVKLLSQDGRSAVLLVGDDYANRPWNSKFNTTMLTDSTFFLTRQNHEDYRLEDSIVMTKYYPEKELEEVRKMIEECKRENDYKL